MSIHRITIEPRPLNERLWTLHRKSIDRTITPAETRELDLMCQALEAGQDGLVGFERGVQS